MKTQLHRPGSLSAILVAIAAFAFAARAQNIWLEGGPVFRGGLRVKVSGSSYVQDMNLHTAPAPLAEPSSVGPAGAYSDRAYDNGYVNLDISTLDPDVVGGPGNTWNWAYDNANQFSAANGTLAFSKQGDTGYTTLQDSPLSGHDDAGNVGIQLAAGMELTRSEKCRLDLVLGFQGVWCLSSKMSMTTYRERKGYITTTDTYDVASTIDGDGNFPGPRTAPGGYTGAFDVPGPVITNIPMSRTSSETVLSTSENRVSFHTESDYYQITLSPRLTCAASKTISFHLQPSLGVGIYDVSVERTEVFNETPTGGSPATLNRWRDTQDKTSVQFVAGISGGAEVELGGGFYAGIFGGYDWTFNAVKIRIGPNELSADSSGWTAGAVVGKRF